MNCPDCGESIGHAGEPIVAIGQADGSALLLCVVCAPHVEGLRQAFPELEAAREQLRDELDWLARKRRFLTLGEVRASYQEGV